MRIVHVLHNFPPESTAGVEVHVMRLAQTQVAEGHDVLIVAGSETLAEEVSCRRERHADLDIARLVRAAPPNGISPSLPARIYNARTTRTFSDLIAQTTPQIVHFHHLMNLCRTLPGVARQRGARVVFSVHDYWFICPTLLLQDGDGLPCGGPGSGVRCVRCRPGIQGRNTALRLVKSTLRAAVGRTLLGKADALIVPSVFVADLLRAAGVRNRVIRHVPYGVPKSPSAILTTEPKTGGTDGPVFGYVGSLKQHKGVADLVRAFSGLEPDVPAQLEIYGDTDRDPYYGRYVQHLGANDPRIRFRGPFPQERVFDVMSRFDFLVVPSLWRETGPQVALEALAAGAAVLGSDAGGLREIVRPGENGLLFQSGDIESLRDCILKACQGSVRPPRSLEDCGGNEPRTIHRNAAQLEEVYREVLEA